MLYATVRNRKISVKKPTTIPCNGKNVDFLTLDLDEDWDGIVSILCTFCNDYLETKRQKKTVIETEETVTHTKGDAVTFTKVETDKEVKKEDLTAGEEEEPGTTTTTETKEETVDTVKITTVTKTTTTVSYVEVSEAASVKRGVLCFPGDEVKVPAECVRNVGQLSVWLTGYDAEIVAPDGDIEDPEQFTTDSTKVLTMATPDSFWELVENGEPAGNLSDDEATTLYVDAMAAVGLAESAANAAKATADDLSNKAASGAFNGAPGRDGRDGEDGNDGFSPTVDVTKIEGGHRVAIADKVGTSFFDVMDGKDGTGTGNGANGATFIPSVSDGGVISWTNNGGLDNPEPVNLVEAVLNALPNGDEVSY